MRQDGLFGSGSLAAAGMVVVLAEVFHPLMLSVIRVGDTAAWFGMLLAAAVALALFLPVALFLSTLQGGNLITLARTAAGTTGALVTGLLVCGGLLFHAGMVIRAASEMAVSAVYPHTPQTFVMTALGLCTLYGAYGGLSTLVRSCRLFLPFIILGALVLLVGSYGWGEVRYLLPLPGPGLPILMTGSVGLAGLFAPLGLFLLMGAGHLHDKSRLLRAGIWAIGLSAVIFAAAIAVFLISFPLPMGYSVTFPLHEMARIVVGGRFFERIEGAWVFLWFYATACHLAALLHTAAAAYADAFGMPTHRHNVLPLVALGIVIALFPPDQGRTLAWHEAFLPLALVIGLILPLVLTVVAALRNKLERKAPSSEA